MGRFSSLIILLTCSILIVSSFSHHKVSPTTNELVDSDFVNYDLTSSNSRLSRSNSVTFTNVTPTIGLSGVSGNFFAWGDYNNDGYQDLLINGGRLFKNNGPSGYTFSEVTSTVGLSGGGNGAWADYDNDGYLDLYCTGNDILWHNQGPPTYNFIDVTTEAGNIRDNFPTTAVGWGDYDLDGYLDMYIANGEDWNDGNPIYYPDFLYHNNGDGTFTDVTTFSGIRNFGGPYYGRGVEWGDYNNDSWPDVYISNYRISQNWLFHNNRNGTFTDLALEKGVAGEESQRMGNTYYGHTVGSAWADLDNDGDLDLFESNLVHKDLYRGPICGDSQLYRNNGVGGGYSFTDVRPESGIPEKNIGGGEDELYVGIAIGDYDNDGFLDLFIPQIYDLEYSYSYLYHSNGDWTFTNVSDDAGVLVWNTYGGAWCDYNNDGYLDLITGGKGSADPNASYEVHLYKNNGNGNSWLKVKVEGRYCNKLGIGVRVSATANGITQTREVEGGMGCHSQQNSIPVEFGFGSYSGTVSIELKWPTGLVQKLENVQLNQQITIEEPEQSPDLGINSISYSNINPIQGETVPIWVGIVNYGYLTAKHAMVRFYDGEPPNTPELIDAMEINDLYYNEYILLETEWDTTGQAGRHNIWIVIEDVVPNDSNNDNNGRDININVREKNEVPIAKLVTMPLEDLLPGDSIFFNGSNSTDDLWISQYDFRFGDGNSTGWIPEPTIKYAYQQPGTYFASLKVVDNEGAVSTNIAEVEIIVNAPPQPPPPNRAPVIDNLTANPTELAPLETATIKVVAHDPDNDEMSYYFFASYGKLGSKEYKSTATWEAPEEPGMYTISVMVSDGELYSDQASIDIKVSVIEVNHPPVINEISITPLEVYPEDIITIIVLANDPDPDDILTYYFEVTGGEIVGSGSKVSWQAPAEVGVYYIHVIVTDSNGLHDEQEVSVIVNEPDYPPEIIECSIHPASIKNNEPASVLITVEVQDRNGLFDIDQVLIDLSPIAGDSNQKLYDNGKHGDLQSNDGIYSYEYLVPSGLTEGSKTMKITIEDYATNKDTDETILEIKAGDLDRGGRDTFLPGFELIIIVFSLISVIIYLSRKKQL